MDKHRDYIIGCDPAMGIDSTVIAIIHPDGIVEIIPPNKLAPSETVPTGTIT